MTRPVNSLVFLLNWRRDRKRWGAGKVCGSRRVASTGVPSGFDWSSLLDKKNKKNRRLAAAYGFGQGRGGKIELAYCNLRLIVL